MKVKLFITFFIFSIFTLYSQENINESDLLINSPDTENNQTQTEINNGDLLGTTDYLVVVLVLIIVIIGLYFVLKLVKKIGGSRLGIDNDLIHVLSTKALKGTTALHLIEVGNQIFLVGATDSSINRISEITDQESKDMIALNLSVDNEENKTFFQFLSDKLNKNQSVTSEATEHSKPDLNTQKEKLDRF